MVWTGLPPRYRDWTMQCLRTMTTNKAKTVNAADQHMDVLIEVAEKMPGLMVAADGTEVALQ